MESALGMNLIAVLAQHHNIARAMARNEELRAELQAAQTALAAVQATLATAQQGKLDAKATLAASQKCEQAAKAALAALQVELAEAKAKQLEAETTTKEEKAASLSSMESMLYHCWAFNATSPSWPLKCGIPTLRSLKLGFYKSSLRPGMPPPLASRRSRRLHPQSILEGLDFLFLHIFFVNICHLAWCKVIFPRDNLFIILISNFFYLFVFSLIVSYVYDLHIKILGIDF
ncbi:uncharacterized protein LOC133803924 [Humulus lupulus]|uniref:uncharacterized protein LOC133803924 n=1 Tax=Humulus lupulus TaxID=3486 RepID=UPI002B4046A5|nr:uncharacterized protein LOC133803924 [Humulus lupulus]